VSSNIFKIVLIVFACVFVIFVIYISIPFTALFVHGVIEGLKYDSAQEPKPQVTYGEFSLELTYTVNDKTINIKDVYVCEYSGYDESINLRRWNGYIKSSQEVGFLIFCDKSTKVFCKLGDPSYYMGDSQQEPHPIIIEDKGMVSGVITEDELLKNYEIKIISWNVMPPIENSFEEFRNTENTVDG